MSRYQKQVSGQFCPPSGGGKQSVWLAASGSRHSFGNARRRKYDGVTKRSPCGRRRRAAPFAPVSGEWGLSGIRTRQGRSAPCVWPCEPLCAPIADGARPLPLQADSGRFWAAVSPSLERGRFPSGLFTEDEKKSRIKAGGAVGASGRSLRPAVRVVTGVLRCIKSGVKNSRRGSRLRSRFPRGYCRNKKTGVNQVSSSMRSLLLDGIPPTSEIAPHETKIEALPRAGKCDA